jgi:hypothetical protein
MPRLTKNSSVRSTTPSPRRSKASSATVPTASPRRGAGLSGGPWDYVERIEVTDRASYEAELAEKGKELLTELYDKYLEKSKTVSVWSERIEP